MLIHLTLALTTPLDGIVSKYQVEVCVPKLVLNETRQDETGGQFPNLWDRDKTTVILMMPPLVDTV